jgi:ankyrin repeat protein
VVSTSHRSEALAASPAAPVPPRDPAAELRDAAAAGRTAEVQALLDQGAPVDAPDARGETALMKSVQAGHPAAAALLRRRGASLDRPDHDGRSARDMAADKGDAALDQAMGLGTATPEK